LNQEFLVYLGSRGMMVVLQVAGPILLATMAIGIVIAILQAATQIQEMTLTFIPKIVVAAVILLLLGSWMGTKIVSFTIEIFREIPNLTGI
jgi:flagellar biosynthetic protein FliQ